MKFMKDKIPNIDLARNVLKGIFKGINHLQMRGIVHRDIKPDNIMMSSSQLNAAPKIIDFGLSTILYKGAVSGDPYGTLAFCSPEIIMNKSHTKQTDIWSLGILSHILLTGTVPFLNKD